MTRRPRRRDVTKSTRHTLPLSRPRLRPLGFALVTCLVATSLASPAAADEKQTCVTASVNAQKLRMASRLTEAREQLLVCARSECPKLVQQDCTQWMSEVVGMMPTIVPSAKDPRGRDLVDVQVSVDGKVIASALDGKALAIDPGVHTVHFETHGARPVDEQVVVRQGEKNRIISVRLGEEVPVVVLAPDRAAPAPPPRREPTSSAPVAAFVVGGLGLAALGTALVVNLGASSDARFLRDTCAPRCAQSDVDDIDRRYTVAAITAAAGATALVAGVVLFILHGSGKGSSALAVPTVTVGAGGATAGATFRF